MSPFGLMWSEIRHRKLNFIVSLIALSFAAALFVAGPSWMKGFETEQARELTEIRNSAEVKLVAIRSETEEQLDSMQGKLDASMAGLNKQTKRIMRDLGFNLRIIHRNTDLNQLYANFEAFDMPQEYIQRIADSPEITKVVHLVATLKSMIKWQDKPRLLVGMAPETVQSHIEKKAPMGFRIEPGTVYLGHETAKGIALGDKIDIQGSTFEVAKILDQHGRREEDIAIFMNLADAQKVLGKENRISEIVALGCKCKTIERIEEIRDQLEAVLPEAKVLELKISADARDRQRKQVETAYRRQMEDFKSGQAALEKDVIEKNEEQIAAALQRHDQVQHLLGNITQYAIPAVVFICAVWAGVMAWSNVRERRSEIGLLRAVGRTSANIAGLFLGRALLLGLLAGIVGCLLGYFASVALAQGLRLPVEDLCRMSASWQCAFWERH